MQNAALHPLGTAPANPVVGQVYYDTSVGVLELKIWNGSAWDIVGKEYTLADGIFDAVASGDNNTTIKYQPYATAADGVFSATTARASGVTALAYSGHLFVNKLNNVEIEQSTHGFTLSAGSTDKNTLTFNDSAS